MRNILNVDPRAASETKPTRLGETTSSTWIFTRSIKACAGLTRDDKNDYTRTNGCSFNRRSQRVSRYGFTDEIRRDRLTFVG